MSIRITNDVLYDSGCLYISNDSDIQALLLSRGPLIFLQTLSENLNRIVPYATIYNNIYPEDYSGYINAADNGVLSAIKRRAVVELERMGLSLDIKNVRGVGYILKPKIGSTKTVNKETNVNNDPESEYFREFFKWMLDNGIINEYISSKSNSLKTDENLTIENVKSY